MNGSPSRLSADHTADRRAGEPDPELKMTDWKSAGVLLSPGC